MATYAIGDLQGCMDELQALLGHVGYEPADDVLWFTGDLVNRGPQSLESLRFVRGLGERAVTVLGNHDLHLLAIDCGVRNKVDPGLQAIMDAPDRAELLEWLRRLPLLHHDERLGYTMVHAGLPPQWSAKRAAKCARETETVLGGPDYRDFLARMYGDKPDLWSKDLAGHKRLRFIINAFTRLRYCTPDGRLDFKAKGSPGSQPAPLLPWYAIDGRKSAGMRIVFGHWAALHLEHDYQRERGVFHLDTGCVWGQSLTAMRLDDGRYFSVSCESRGRRE